MSTVNIGGVPHDADEGDDFFNANLAADQSHTHDAAGHTTTVNDIGEWDLNTEITSEVVGNTQAGINMIQKVITLLTEQGFAISAQNHISRLILDANSEGGGFKMQDTRGYYEFETQPDSSPSRDEIGLYGLRLTDVDSAGHAIQAKPQILDNALRIKTITSADSPYNFDPARDEILFVDNDGSVVINFPSASDSNIPTDLASLTRMAYQSTGGGDLSMNISMRAVIKVLNDASTNTVTLEPDGTETIQDIGAAATSNLVINGAGDEGGSWTVVSDGTNLHVI